MADRPARQGASRNRFTSSIASIEHNLAELIAQDISELDHQDAIATAQSAENASKSPTDMSNMQDDSNNTVRRPVTESLEMSENTQEPTKELTNENIDQQEHTPDTATRPSDERLGMGEEAQQVAAIPKKDWIDSHEIIRKPTRRSWRDRLEMQEDADDTERKSTRDRLRGNENAAGDEATTRPWRHRLSMQEDTSDTLRQSRESNEGSPYRRGSWRERLGMQLDVGATSTSSSRNRLDTSEDTHVTSTRPRRQRSESQDYTSSTHSRPWRERLNMNRETSDTYIPWRERYGMQGVGNTWHTRLDMPEDKHDTKPEPLRHILNRYSQDNECDNIDSSAEESVIKEAFENNAPEMQASANTGEVRSESIEHEEEQANNHEGRRINQEEEQAYDLAEEDNIEAVQNNEPEADNVPESGQLSVEERNETGNVKPEKNWTTEDVLKLLVKAINYRSPIKDIQTVLKWGIDVNTPFKNGLCALHYAAYTNFVACVEILLQHGANINVTDDIGYTPLHLAARCGHYKIMEKLIDNGAMITFNEPGTEIKGIDKLNKLGFTNTEPVNLAIQNCHPECAELLLKNGARADNKYFMGYEISLAPMNDVRCLEVLLQYGASPDVFNRCGLSPLMKACKDHHIDAVRLLLKHGADYNSQCPPLFEQKSVLQTAIASGNIVIINLILAKNPKISRNDNYKYSALQSAIIKGRADICRLLLQRGANAEERTDEEATCLMLACSKEGIRDRKEIVQMLIDCGADVNAYGQSFSYLDPYLSPLSEYLKNIGSSESFNIVECLISNGARVHFTSGDLLLGGRRDPYAILPYAYSMNNFPEIFDLMMQAAQRYNPLAIHVCDNLPEDMKNTLLLVATKPQDLKHIVRQAIRHMLMPGIIDRVKELPLPELMKSYLIFK